MGTGQMLLTVGAIMLLGTVILTTNRSLNNNSTVLLNTNVGLEEISLATSIMEEATGKAFDENTDTNTVSSTSQLTPPASLGQENGDTTDINDFDDFNGLPGSNGRIEVDTLSTGIYYVRTRVYYVSSSNPNVISSVPTWHKRLDIWVWNKDVPDTVKMHTIFSYWYF